MPKYDDFDLNLKQNVSAPNKEPRVTSLSWCTPGTCNNTCKGDSTLKSNCCGGSIICSLGGC
ncbi:gallidermin/nisin family lantibiotic [Enterococcus faecium]|uniref:gallidermin/nisin family lantibiotic n=1 Tax=Enterococcaceae TaxID=81852 RepID=UPI000F64315D|nr:MULTISPECIES: gallidermin/nisin family lantibiotic [Enterococcaceae]QZN88726.1 gallidermin/nisin family lantibiotic [Vagococcus lutrae]RRQ97832.1 gallidermin family protein [Enterococcus faecalis]UQF38492.1 gallidermin/nisin family lantibiotic [Vagococcus lutrae]